MNLSTSYLGLKLKNPFVVGASPFCDNLSACKALEAAGVSALVMHSFFEEQIEAESRALVHHLESSADSYSEASSFFPDYDDYHLGPAQYIRQLKRLVDMLEIPIIASLNGTHLGNWVGYAQEMEDAGASALELNLYQVPTDPGIPADEIEASMVEIVRAVAVAVKLPVAVKLSPFHSATAHTAAMLVASGAAGLVLFNRFYQSDFDIQNLEVVPHLKLSDSSELLLRLRWLSILSMQSEASLACSGGVHTAEDAIKALLAGADAVQLVSVLLKHGPHYVGRLIEGLETWMAEMEYTSVDQLRGAMNLSRCPDPSAHERANYLKILQSWKV